MPFYQRLNTKKKEDKRIIERLLALRASLKKEIPQRTLNETLLVATWNIRDFDKPTYGGRIREAFYYLAEVISKFDIVAVQEVYKDLTALDRLMRILGSHWDYVFSDATEGRRGNGERIAYVYDTRKVKFGGLAGELVLPAVKNEKGELVPSEQIWRTPMICGFQAGWAKFMIASVHILYGKSKANEPRRIKEIRQIAQFLKKRTEDPSVWARKLILLGDFNIFNPKNDTFKELIEAGFVIPEQLQLIATNIGRNKHFDQIAFRERENSFKRTGKAGTFNFFQHVFKDMPKEEKIYKEYMTERYHIKGNGQVKTAKERNRYYRMWRTHQMSDHLPLWVELRIDYADEYLEGKLKKK